MNDEKTNKNLWDFDCIQLTKNIQKQSQNKLKLQKLNPFKRTQKNKKYFSTIEKN
jgi:hypothetical protein